MNMLAQWADQENHRQIRFSVDYSIVNATLVIEAINPTKVSFVCPDSNTVVRSVGVHTDNGRRLLGKQIAESGTMDELIVAISKSHDLAVATD